MDLFEHVLQIVVQGRVRVRSAEVDEKNFRNLILEERESVRLTFQRVQQAAEDGPWKDMTVEIYVHGDPETQPDVQIERWFLSISGRPKLQKRHLAIMYRALYLHLRLLPFHRQKLRTLVPLHVSYQVIKGAPRQRLVAESKRLDIMDWRTTEGSLNLAAEFLVEDQLAKILESCGAASQTKPIHIPTGTQPIPVPGMGGAAAAATYAGGQYQQPHYGSGHGSHGQQQQHPYAQSAPQHGGMGVGTGFHPSDPYQQHVVGSFGSSSSSSYHQRQRPHPEHQRQHQSQQPQFHPQQPQQPQQQQHPWFNPQQQPSPSQPTSSQWPPQTPGSHHTPSPSPHSGAPVWPPASMDDQHAFAPSSPPMRPGNPLHDRRHNTWSGGRPTLRHGGSRGHGERTASEGASGQPIATNYRGAGFGADGSVGMRGSGMMPVQSPPDDVYGRGRSATVSYGSRSGYNARQSSLDREGSGGTGGINIPGSFSSDLPFAGPSSYGHNTLSPPFSLGTSSSPHIGALAMAAAARQFPDISPDMVMGTSPAVRPRMPAGSAVEGFDPDQSWHDSSFIGSSAAGATTVDDDLPFAMDVAGDDDLDLFVQQCKQPPELSMFASRKLDASQTLQALEEDLQASRDHYALLSQAVNAQASGLDSQPGSY